MRVHRVFLDLDDVLNSLSLNILKHFGCDVEPFEYHKFPVSVGYDVARACQLLGGNVPLTDDQEVDVPKFWDRVTELDLWRNAPKSRQCDWLVNIAADAVGKENVFIATTPTKDPKSHADKLHWIWDNLPEWIHRQYFITPRKWLLGKPGCLLFDDNDENCKLFSNEGGKSVLVPRPWNTRHHLDTETIIQEAISETMWER